MTASPSVYEACKENLDKLARWYTGNEGDRNEATTRFALIDRLFIECLGWTHDDVVTEDHVDGQYADYVFSAPRRILTVEAKREGNYFELPAGMNEIEYSIKTLCKDYPDVKKAVDQVGNYCHQRGIRFAAVCNGHQLIAFLALRLDIPYLEGRAVVFPSLLFMKDHFLDMWQALSKPAIEQKN